MLHKHYAAFIKNLAADDMLSFLGALERGPGEGVPRSQDGSGLVPKFWGSGRVLAGHPM
jgi:hypothetical protein